MAHPRRRTLLSLLLALLLLCAVGCAQSGGSSDASRQAPHGQESSAEESPSDQELDVTEEDAEQRGSAEDQDDADETSDGSASTTDPEASGSTERGPTVTKDGWYTSKEEVALYIHTYGRLPGNFISKTKARDRGWDAKEGNLDEVCPGMSIGGSKFWNDEGALPDKRGRSWTECDINYDGGYRGPERIVFSNDGLVFYTGDHYKTFERLY